jgi:hypothetical protein
MYCACGFITCPILHWKFFGLTKQEDQSMLAWIGKMHSTMFRLQEINVQVPNKDVIMVLANSLPEEYDNFVITLDSTPPNNFTLEYVISCLLNE